MESVCIGFIPGPLENQISPSVGQDDLYEVLKLKSGHNNLIENISPMLWDMEVQLTLN